MSVQFFLLVDSQTTEEHANLGTLRSISWKFEFNPSNSLGGDVKSSTLTDRRTMEQLTNIGIQELVPENLQ